MAQKDHSPPYMNPHHFPLNSSSPRNKKSKAPLMEDFFTEWIRHEESILSSLLLSISTNNCTLQSSMTTTNNLISSSVSHFESYYQRKSNFADQNVLQAFYPQYLTPLERTFLWIGGFRPSLAFKFIPADQSDCATHLKREVLVEERALSVQMASLQEGLASPEVLNAMKEDRLDGNTSVERVARQVGIALRALLASADRLRLRALRAIIEALTPVHSTQFLANLVKFHLEIRRLGLQLTNNNNNGD
ncbi:hypothetical protein LUZ60_003504 [Juncus effusus]|nr:hypothetical protein LUZ60_003504 [Juncus effusus]